MQANKRSCTEHWALTRMIKIMILNNNLCHLTNNFLIIKIIFTEGEILIFRPFAVCCNSSLLSQPTNLKKEHSTKIVKYAKVSQLK